MCIKFFGALNQKLEQCVVDNFHFFFIPRRQIEIAVLMVC